jgi:nucleotide-binding universal stress UspA family protein
LPVEDRAGARRVADDASERARHAGIATITIVAVGDPATEIAAQAEKLRADLVVVGSRGLGAVSGALLGSVSSALIRRSRVPVTVVAHAHVREPMNA